MKIDIRCTAILAVVLLGACAHGQYGGLDPDPKRWGIVFCTNNPGHACTPAQRSLAETLLNDAALVVNREMAGADEAAAAGGGVSGLASIVATIVTVANPLAGAVMWIAAADNATQAAAGGLSNFSFSRVYATIEIANTLKEDRIKQKVTGYEIAEFIRIVPAFNRATTSMEEFRSGQTAPPR